MCYGFRTVSTSSPAFRSTSAFRSSGTATFGGEYTQVFGFFFAMPVACRTSAASAGADHPTEARRSCCSYGGPLPPAGAGLDLGQEFVEGAVIQPGQGAECVRPFHHPLLDDRGDFMVCCTRLQVAS